MVWKPGWDLLDPDKLIVAPLAMRYEFEASPKWHAQNPGAMDAVGDLLIRRQVAALQSWLLGQRQNARVSNLLVYRTRLRLPGITAEFTKQFGHETLRIIAQPENAGGRIPTKIDVDSADVIKVKPEFHGWPIPGYPNKDYMIGWVNTTVYFWDPVCAPGLPGNDDAVLSVGTDIIQDGPEQTAYRIVTFDPAYGFGFSNTLSPVYFTANGFLKQFQPDIKCGSKVVPTPLSGRQYWEVQIKKLQTDVPGDITKTNFIDHTFGGGFNFSAYGRRLDDFIGGQGETTTSVTFSVDLSGEGTIKRIFPSTLNTWLTPAIGVLPEHMVTTKGKPATEDTPAVIGVDDDPTIRSIGAVTTSYLWDPVTEMEPTWDGVAFTGYIDASPTENTDSALAGHVFRSWKKVFEFTQPSTDSLPPGKRNGKYCPVIVGRGDLIWDLEEPTDPGTTTIRDNIFRHVSPTDRSDSQSNYSGYYPGIDLGELKETDVVMLATDAKTGEIWFGKNGKWHGRDGALDKFPKTSDIKMDVGSSATNKYYPAVSWRVGGIEVKILLGTAQKYTPPAGFDRLSKAASVTIPGPDKDDPRIA